jgi:hypothetical protein
LKKLLMVLVALAVPISAQAASKHKRHHPSRVYAAQPQVACTQFGCLPVQRGCYPAQGRTFSGLPSDFDVVVCPGRGTLYGIR